MKEVKEVVHVPTIELAEEVLRVAKENGFKEPFFKSEHYLKTAGEELCFRFNEVYFSFASKYFYKKEGYTIITAEEFLNRYKPKFRPIAMRCNQEQFEAVKDKLAGCRMEDITEFESCSYLVNNYSNHILVITNTWAVNKSNHGRQVFEEWNEKTFLEYCGIEVKDEVNELEQLRKENENLKAINENLNKESIEYHNELTLLKEKLKAIEDTPKVGDVCLFWDEGDMTGFYVDILIKVMDDSNYKYRIRNGAYANCIKATNENIQAKIKDMYK